MAMLMAPDTIKAQNFDDYFTDKTLRVDYTFAGNQKQQMIAVDELNVMPRWYGKRQRLAFRPLGSSATTRVKTRFDSKSRKASFPDKTQESSRAHARPDMTSISIAAHHREESGFPPLYRQE